MDNSAYVTSRDNQCRRLVRIPVPGMEATINWYRAASVTLIQFVRLALTPPAVHRTASTAVAVRYIHCAAQFPSLDFTNSGDREASKGKEQLILIRNVWPEFHVTKQSADDVTQRH